MKREWTIREEVKDDALGALRNLSERRNEVFDKALGHFGIENTKDAIKNNVQLYYVGEGYEEYYMKGKLAITLSPLLYEEKNAITMKVKEHY